MREITAAFQRLRDSTLISPFLAAIASAAISGRAANSSQHSQRCHPVPCLSCEGVVCAPVDVCVSGSGWDWGGGVGGSGGPQLSSPALHVLSPLSTSETRLGGWHRAQGCGLSQHSGIVALCREAKVALSAVKWCKGGVSWQGRGLD